MGRGLEHRELDALAVDEALGHALTDGLEGGDLAIELLAVDAVLRGEARRPVGDTRDDRAQRDGRARDGPLEDLTAPCHVAEERRAVDPHVRELDVELRLVVLGFLPLRRDSGRIGRDEEHRDVVTDARGHEHVRRDVQVRNAGLHAVDAPAVAVGRRAW